MADETTVDELIRFLQAELENCSEISDSEMREKRQWQLESAIQESIAFLNDVRERVARNSKVFETDESVRVIARSVNISKEKQSSINQQEIVEGVFCKHCDLELVEDLSFCPGCGKYQ